MGAPDSTPAKKARRDLSLDTKNEILKFRSKHTLEQTLAHFPEASRRTAMRVKLDAAKIRKAVHAGKGTKKRRRPLIKYATLGDKMFEFFCLIRDAQGAVSRSLLEEYIASTPANVQLDLMQKGDHRRDEFFSRWRDHYNVVYRRITGFKQFLPDDYTKRIETFHGLLRSIYMEKRWTTIVCGDETGVRFEDLPNATMAPIGSKKVLIRTTGNEKNMFTVFLHSTLKVDDLGRAIRVEKGLPVILFKGAESGPVSRSIAEAAGDDAGILPCSGFFPSNFAFS
jgi:hypothetical protein